jgi:hypothetical protein
MASTAAAQTATLLCQVPSTTVARPNAVNGTVTITPASGSSGLYDLVINFNDKNNRTFDRYELRLNVTAKTIVPFTLSTANAITLECRIQARGKFVAGTTYGSSTVAMAVVPYPLDYDDFWVNVWGGGSTAYATYYNALQQANVNLGHIYRGNTYYQYLYNLRPNHDFLEDKRWFNMDSASPSAQGLRDTYANTYLLPAGNNYGNATARSLLVRPTSLNDATSLTNMENNIRPRMQMSYKWGPLQWNISDEYGIYNLGSPFDFDLGSAAITQFIAWLQSKYGTIANLNSAWNTQFATFADLSDPINAPAGGQAALIVTQEIRDREFPLLGDLYAAKNFAPWGDFRTFMDETFAAAMKRAVDVGQTVDPAIRVGFEGGQAATPSTGYDYARQLREVGSIEAYDQANAPEYIRSMRYNRYGQRVLSFLTMFNSGSAQDNAYTLWYRLLHYGITSAMIWDSTSFFGSGYTLTAYATSMAPAFGEFENGLVKLLNLGDWDDSEVALLYSQKSIQALWMLDSEAEGKTWINRLSGFEPTRNSAIFAHVGWCKILEDIGVKGRFISYDEVVAGELTSRGVKVLILPKAIAVSDAEMTAIQNWVNAGGVLLADTMCGWFDGNLRRRSIAQGGGWWDNFLGISRVSYGTAEKNGTLGTAYSGSTAIQSAPAGFEGVMAGVTNILSLLAVESGVRTGDGAALIWWGNNSNQPSLICKTYGAGKIVYMNLSMQRYAFTGPNFGVQVCDRLSPGGNGPKSFRKLVSNLLALGGVTPKVAVKQNWNNPGGNDVYNLEKSLHVDGQNRYLGCVVNGYADGINDWWGSRSDTPSVCFGQPGVTNANATLVLNTGAAHVYDVRQGAYLGYGSQFNVTMPVYEGSVFALLPYRVDGLTVDLVEYDPYRQAATIAANVWPVSGTAGNHVLRIEVFDAANNPLSQFNTKVVATNGAWTGVIPFAITDDVTDIRVHVTDVATSVAVDKTLTKYKTDVNGDGGVDVVDLLTFVESFGLEFGDLGYNLLCDFNEDRWVDVEDLLTFVEDFGKMQPE